MKRITLALAALIGLACGENPNEPPPPPPPPLPEVRSVSMLPTDITVDVADPAILFTITVEVKNGASKQVACSTETGTTMASASYLYNHPAVVGKYTVTCRSVADSTKFASATVTIVKYEVLAFMRYGDDSTRARCGGAWCQEIYIQHLDGTGLRRITVTPWLQDFHPSWFPDGKRLAFTRASSNAFITCVVDVGNGGTQCINFNPLTGTMNSSVSPDGRKIAVMYYDQDSTRKIVAAGIAVMDTDGKNLTRLTTTNCGAGFCSTDDRPHWSPDGEWILFWHPDGNIWRMRRDGSEQSKFIVNAIEAVYSPNGERIALSSRRTGKLQIFVMNADGTGLWKLSPIDDNCIGPSWSPEGARIAFSCGGHITDSTIDEDGEVWVMNADGTGEPVNVTKSPKNMEVETAWRPQ